MYYQRTGLRPDGMGSLMIWFLKGKLLVPFTALSTVRDSSFMEFH